MTTLSDFDIDEYAELLQLAKAKYKFIGFDEIRFEDGFILWRHDCDCSLNRALRLAELEQRESIRATYFLNPHSEFYNLLENTQTNIVRRIGELGHHIGLHLDAAYHGIESEGQLEEVICMESRWLREWFSVEVSSFSFHNPTDFLLSCDQDTYGGLINCYARNLRKTVSYCSDSNGYWRFKPLRDVLTLGKEKRLQVLTHPEWWQEKTMTPRRRILRCAMGRARALMRVYDDFLAKCGRKNLS